MGRKIPDDSSRFDPSSLLEGRCNVTTERETQMIGAVEWLLAIRKLASERPSLALVLLVTQPEGVCLVKLGKLASLDGEPAPEDVSRLNREEKRLITVGQKIPAIKSLRERSATLNPDGITKSVTLGLREAKDLCDKWERDEIAAGRLALNRNNVQPFGVGQPH